MVVKEEYRMAEVGNYVPFKTRWIELGIGPRKGLELDIEEVYIMHWN